MERKGSGRRRGGGRGGRGAERGRREAKQAGGGRQKERPGRIRAAMEQTAHRKALVMAADISSATCSPSSPVGSITASGFGA